MINSLVGKALTVFVMISFLFSTSCTSSRLLSSQSDTLQNELKKGDRVKITTIDGRNFNFIIVGLSSEAIIGEKREYQFSVQTDELGKRIRRIEILFNEIAIIQKMQFDPGKTAITTGVVFVSLTVLLFLLTVATNPDDFR